IRKNLLTQLARQHPDSMLAPGCALRTAEKVASKYECLGVRPKMVAQQVVLEATAQPASLHCEALYHARNWPIARQQPFHPIHDAKRGRIWLPTVAHAGSVFCDPFGYQGTVPLHSPRRLTGCQVIKVMGVVEPKLWPVRAVPIRRRRNQAFHS